METTPYRTKAERLTTLADAAQSKADSTPNAARCSFYEGQASAYRGAAGMLTDLGERERRLLQRLAKRSWRSSGRRLRARGDAERQRDEARAVLAELPADFWPESEGAPAAAAQLADRARLADTASVAEVARLRARVRVEAEDVEWAGVTRAHVEAWLCANGWSPSSRETGWNSHHGTSAMWRAVDRDERGVSLYERGMIPESVNTIAYHFKRPGLDILDEMAAMQLESDL